MMSSDENPISTPGRVGQTVVEQPEMAAGEPPSVPIVAVPASPTAESPRSSRSGETLLQSLLSTIVIVLFVITFIVQAFQIPSPSMENTLLVGDYLLVDKIHFGQGGTSSWFFPYRPLQRGDIVVFHYPVDPSQHFVKRVVGLPGDHIRLRDKTVFVNDVPLEESYAVHVRGDYDPYRDNFPSASDATGQVDADWRTELPQRIQQGELVVPKDEYFVMGDNRDRSLDSRYWGFVPRDNIVGRPLVIYLSVRQRADESAGNDKLFNSGHLLTHVWQFARWDRMFHRVH